MNQVYNLTPGFSSMSARTVTCDTIVQDMKIRADQLRQDIAGLDAKRSELATLEKMIAAAESATDEVAGTAESLK